MEKFRTLFWILVVSGAMLVFIFWMFTRALSAVIQEWPAA